MRLTIRPERPSGPYFTSSTLSLSGAQNIGRNGFVDTAQRTLHAVLSPHENALEHAPDQGVVESDIGRRTVDPRERLALLGRGRARVVGDVAQLESRALGTVDLEARNTEERAGQRSRRGHLNRLVLEERKRGADPPLIQGAAGPPIGKRRGLVQEDLNARGDRKSTRLNSSHLGNSYAVFCLQKKVGGNARVPECVVRMTGVLDRRLGVLWTQTFAVIDD